jgi:periplasmic protein TonB
MLDIMRELFQRPSRLFGWGVVMVIHLIAWQVLTHGLNWVKTIPVLKAVQVSLINNDAPAEMPSPSLPKMEQPVNTELFIPTPEVTVVQESAMVVSTTAVASPVVMSDVAPPSIPSQPPLNSLLVLNESEVDYLVKPDVRYPPASKRANERGTVLLSVIVNSQGWVEYVRVYRSSGYRRLDETAMRAVHAMRVRPYLRNGIAMAVELRVPVEFS